MKTLITRGAKFLPNSNGNTPLHWAALNGHTAAVEALLTGFADASIDVLSRNAFGKSALTDAINAGHENIARLILSHRSAEPPASFAPGLRDDADAGPKQASGGAGTSNEPVGEGADGDDSDVLDEEGEGVYEGESSDVAAAAGGSAGAAGAAASDAVAAASLAAELGLSPSGVEPDSAASQQAPSASGSSE